MISESSTALNDLMKSFENSSLRVRLINLGLRDFLFGIVTLMEINYS